VTRTTSSGETSTTTVIDHTLTLIEGDIARRADGSLDRTATARNIALRAYTAAGFSSLSRVAA